MRTFGMFSAAATAAAAVLVWAGGVASTRAAATATTGRSLYMQYCASCHGERLQGGNAQSLVDGVWQFGQGRGYVTRNIKFGLTHLGMPGYEKTLSDDQIRQVVDFLFAEEQTAAPTPPELPRHLQTLDYDLDVAVVADGLETPWAIAFLDGDRLLVTERPGRLRLIADGTLAPAPIAGTPAVLNEGQGGLLDVAVDPYDRSAGWVYLAYSHAQPAAGQDRPGAMTRLVRGRLRDHAWVDQQVLYTAPAASYGTTRHHYGCRIVFDAQGFLYFGVGDRGVMEQAQDLSRPNGKIHRLHKDGTVPADNPFAGRAGALPTIFAYGVRNPQGLAVHPVTGVLWETEHGPLGGDEVNRITAGTNYGWPVISYGRNYDGSLITDQVAQAGMAQPVYYWRPSIAVCGMDFVTGAMFETWRNHLLVTALKYEEVRLLDVRDGRVLHDEVILKNAGRVRDVACAADGSVYVVLNDPGRLLRLTRRR